MSDEIKDNETIDEEMNSRLRGHRTGGTLRLQAREPF